MIQEDYVGGKGEKGTWRFNPIHEIFKQKETQREKRDKMKEIFLETTQFNESKSSK